MLKSKDGLRALRQAYQAIWKDINWTSLCVASLPVDANRGNGHGWIEGALDEFPFSMPVDRPGWLGLGDAVLKEPSEVEALKRHFGVALAQIGIYSIPHHGSDDNFCDELVHLCSTPTDRPSRVVRYATATRGKLQASLPLR